MKKAIPHWLDFEKLVKRIGFKLQKIEPNDQTAIQRFVEFKRQEVDLFETAWEGGDVYMTILANHLYEREANDLKTASERRTPEERAAMLIFKACSPDLVDFAMRMNRANWYYDYIDDRTQWRAAKDVCDKLGQEARENGGDYLAVYEAHKAA